ncbi:MAG: hypothetical protein K0M45_03865 [Candidatus Paracaedibacteraceae bacterium]|nr:hypothetical protein [Candidatus Paracaedibacteraceae bacterium]
MRHFSLIAFMAFALTSTSYIGAADRDGDPPLPLNHLKKNIGYRERPHPLNSFPSTRPPFEPFHLQAFEENLNHLSMLITTALQAEENIPLTHKIILKEQLQSLTQELQVLLDEVLVRLKPVEDMLLNERRVRVLTAFSLDQKDPALQGLMQLLQDIRRLLQADPSLSIREPLLKLEQYYDEFIKKLCASTPEERAILLTQRAKLSGDRLGHYLIPQDLAREALSKTINGLSLRVLQDQQEGQNAVRPLDKVHFKVGTSMSDINPTMEWAMHSFSQLLMGQGTAPSASLKLENVSFRPFNERDYAHNLEAKKAKALFNQYVFHPKPEDRITAEAFFSRYPGFEEYFTKSEESAIVQASQTMGDLSLLDFLAGMSSGQYQLSQLDPVSYSALVISSLITVPTDAKDDNLRVIHKEGIYHLISIDNDRALADMIALKEVTNKHVIQGKNILYLLPEPMTKWFIAPSVRDRLLGTDGVTFILDWLSILEQQNKRYERVKGDYRSKHPHPYFPLSLKPGIAVTLLKRLQTLQHYLEDASLTHGVLLQRMFPLAHYGYQKLRQEYGHECHKAQDRLYMASGYPDFYLEDLLAEEEDSIATPLNEALAAEKALVGAYEQGHTHSIGQEIDHLLDSIDLHALSSQQRLRLLSRIVECWPDKVGRLWQGSEIVCKILKDLVTETSHQYLSVSAASILAYVLRFPDVDINYFYHETMQSTDKQTLLHILATSDHPELETLFDLILQRKAKVQLQDNYGLTPLDKALILEHEQAILKLLFYQADLYVQPSCLFKLVTTYASSHTFIDSINVVLRYNPQAAWMKTLTTILPSSPSTRGLKVELFLPKNGRYQIAHHVMPPESVKALFAQGKFQEVYHTKNHSIGLLEHETGDTFLKRLPTFPGIEAAVQALTQRIFPEIVFPTTLAKIKGEPYLLSQGRACDPGKSGFEAYHVNTLQAILKNTPDKLKNLDPYFFSQSVIMAMLLNPEDGKPSNYVLEPSHRNPGLYRIIGIDNDQAFAPEITKPDEQAQSKPVVRLKSILFCLDQMEEIIHPEVANRILELDVYALLKDWLTELHHVHTEHARLFPEPNTSLNQQNCFLGVPFQEGEARDLAHKLITLQLLLKENLNCSLKYLFKKVCLFSAHHYGKALKRYRYSPVLERFELLDGDSYALKGSREVHTTLTSGRDLLKARNIPVGKDRKKAHQEDRTYDPSMMLKELEKDQKTYNQQALTSLILQRQTNNRMVYQILKKKNLKKVDLDAKEYTLAQQQQMLEHIRRLKLNELAWRNAISFENLLTAAFPLKTLEGLNLESCRFLRPEFLHILAREATNLKYLNLSHINTLDKVRGAGVLGRIGFSPLLFSQLTSLFLNRCETLEEIHLQSPLLHTFEAANCPQLRILRLTAPQLIQADFSFSILIETLDILKLVSPHLQALKVVGCPKVVLPQELAHLSLSSLDLSKLNDIPLLAEVLKTADNYDAEANIFRVKIILIGYYGKEREKLMNDLTGDPKYLTRTGAHHHGDFGLVRTTYKGFNFAIQVWELREENYYDDNSVKKFYFKETLAFIFDFPNEPVSYSLRIIDPYQRTIKRLGYGHLPRLLLEYAPRKIENFEAFEQQIGIMDHMVYEEDKAPLLDWICRNSLYEMVKNLQDSHSHYEKKERPNKIS